VHGRRSVRAVRGSDAVGEPADLGAGKGRRRDDAGAICLPRGLGDWGEEQESFLGVIRVLDGKVQRALKRCSSGCTIRWRSRDTASLGREGGKSREHGVGKCV
jgi:hypothetical protein